MYNSVIILKVKKTIDSYCVTNLLTWTIGYLLPASKVSNLTVFPEATTLWVCSICNEDPEKAFSLEEDKVNT